MASTYLNRYQALLNELKANTPQDALQKILSKAERVSDEFHSDYNRNHKSKLAIYLFSTILDIVHVGCANEKVDDYRQIVKAIKTQDKLDHGYLSQIKGILQRYSDLKRRSVSFYHKGPHCEIQPLRENDVKNALELFVKAFKPLDYTEPLVKGNSSKSFLNIMSYLQTVELKLFTHPDWKGTPQLPFVNDMIVNKLQWIDSHADTFGLDEYESVEDTYYDEGYLNSGENIPQPLDNPSQKIAYDTALYISNNDGIRLADTVDMTDAISNVLVRLKPIYESISKATE